MNTWKKTTLGEVVAIIDGDRGVNYPKNHEFVNDGYCLFLNAKNVPNDSFSFNEKMFITQEKDSILGKGKLKRGDFVLTTRGTVGNFAFYSEKVPFDNIRINSGMVILRAKDKVIDKGFLKFYLKSHFFTDQVLFLSSGSAQPQLPIRDLCVFEIQIPPLPEQKAIAAVLLSFDDKIELLRRQNKTLEAIAQAIFKEWFVKFKVKGEQLKLNPKTGLPEGWRMGRLGEEFQIVMGQSPDGKSYNESGNGMIFFQGRAEFQDRFPTIRLYTTEPKRIAEKFDVLVSVRAPVGDINVAFDRCCIGRGLGAVRGQYKSYTLYKIKSLKDAFDKFESEGTVFGCIGKDAFANIETIIPDSKTVKAFEAIASILDVKIYNNYSQIQTLSKLRDTLLPKLMKGEIRVKL